MRILLVHRYYWPDVPAYAHMLRIMGQRFAAEGHDVSVLSTMPSYNDAYRGDPPASREVVDGIRVRRIRLLSGEKSRPVIRAVNLLWYAGYVLTYCARHRADYDLVTMASYPPITMGVIGRIVSRFTNARFLYHYQDLWPEVATASGVMQESFWSRLARRVDRGSASAAAAAVVLSDDMRSTLADRGVDTSRTRVINNFIIDTFDPEAPMDESLRKRPDSFRVVFAGNLGRFQGLEQVVDAAHLLRDEPGIEFVFVGNGSLEKELRRRAGDLVGRSVQFVPFQPLPSVMRLLSDADLALISLAPGVIRAAYPSKTMTNVESDCRILAVVEPGSQLARQIVDNDLGSVCASAEPAGIAAAVRAEFERPRDATPGAIRKVGRELFGQEAILGQWVELLARLELAS